MNITELTPPRRIHQTINKGRRKMSTPKTAANKSAAKKPAARLIERLFYGAMAATFSVSLAAAQAPLAPVVSGKPQVTPPKDDHLLKELTPVPAKMLLNPPDKRLADVAPHLRRLGIQPAEADQHGQCEEPDRGLELGHDGRRHRDHADGARWRALSLQLARQGAGAGRHQRRAVVGIQARHSGRNPAPERQLRRQAQHGDGRRQADRRDLGRPYHRARHEDRQGGLGSPDRGLQEGLALHRRPAGCQPTSSCKA